MFRRLLKELVISLLVKRLIVNVLACWHFMRGSNPFERAVTRGCLSEVSSSWMVLLLQHVLWCLVHRSNTSVLIILLLMRDMIIQLLLILLSICLISLLVCRFRLLLVLRLTLWESGLIRVWCLNLIFFLYHFPTMFFYPFTIHLFCLINWV